MRAFEAAAQLPADGRRAFLHTELAGDAAAITEVESLLSHHDADESLVATGIGLLEVGPELDAMPALPLLKGNYRILRTIGEGGMGVVFEAEQSFPRRRVALKAIRPGMASRGLLRRFRNEVQILARLQHPGIAQLYEAGIADEHAPDQAYFVMEYVDGTALTHYADSNKLDRRGRLTLLARICDAIQHAHQRGVIHRDLKPANILVTADGSPKIVDFGVARAVQADPATTHSTQSGQLLGTPSYMSPEQIQGGEVDTRSDIYSLGVIAYELLSRRLPFDLANVPITKAAKVVAEEEPPSLGSVDRTLRGDPEVIVSKAMAKEPLRRYASAAEMASDLRHLLAGEAIAARGDSTTYILLKQLRRHRAAAGVVTLALLGLVTFAVYASIAATQERALAIVADRARAEAVQAQSRAEVATSEALQAKRDAELAGERALDELVHANIERGRMAGALNNIFVAEDTLWREYVAHPNLPAARWALWELYDRTGSKWVVQGGLSGSIAAASTESRSVVVAGGNGRIIALDAATGKQEAVRAMPGTSFTSIAVAPGRDRVLAGIAKGGAQILPLNPDAPPLELSGWPAKLPLVRGTTFTPSGDLAIAACEDQVVRVWNAHTGELVKELAVGYAPGAVCTSSDGRLLLVGTDVRNLRPTVTGWNLSSGTKVLDLGIVLEEQMSALAFGRDDLTIYVGSPLGPTVAWDRATGTKNFSFSKPRGSVLALAQSPDGRRLLCCSLDQLYVIDAATGELLVQLPNLRFQAASACWADDNDVVVLSIDGVLRRIDTRIATSLTRLGGYPTWCFSVAYSGDGRFLGIGSGSSIIDFYDTATHQRVGRHTMDTPKLRTRGLVFLPGQHVAVAGCQDGVIRFVVADSGEVVRSIESVKDEIFSVAVDPSGTIVAAGHSNGQTFAWNISTGEPLPAIPKFTKRIEGLAFAPNGRTLVISALAKGVVLWDVIAGREISRIPTTAMPWAVLFSPEGDRLYVTTWTGTLEVFETATGKSLAVVQGHQRLIPGLALSSDGRIVATSAEDGMIKLWDTHSFRSLMTLSPQASTVVGLAFNQDTSRLACAAAFREILEYDLRANEPRIDGHDAFFRARIAGDEASSRARLDVSSPKKP